MFTNNKISQLGEEILGGNIKVNPLMADGVDSCRFCSFQSVCCINSKLPGIEPRKNTKTNKDEIIDMMKTENARCKAKKGD